MSEISATPAAGATTAAPPIFARKATGLVREVPLSSAMAFAASAIPIGVALSIILFGVFLAFPGANIVVGIVVALATIPFVGGAFALLSATMPRIGGDYLYCSRIISPILGMASNFVQFGATVFGTVAAAYLFPKAGLTSAFATVGVLTGSKGWLNAATVVGEKGWVFVSAAFLVIFFTVLSVFGTKIVLRWVAWFYFISVGSVILALITLLFISHSKFVGNLNLLSHQFTHANNTYTATVAAGVKGGLRLPDHGGYSTKNTIGALFTILSITGALWYSIYLSGEIKRAGRRNRQLIIVVGTSFIQGIFVLLAVLLFLQVIGYDFFAAASTGFYGAPVPGFYNFFAGVAANSPFLGITITGLLLLGFPPFVYANLGVAQRVPFAWAFDGIVPRRLARVNPRTHTPNVVIVIVGLICTAMCAWAAFTSSFLQVISYANLLGYGPFIPVGIAAALLPFRRPDLYEGSPADWRIGRVPVITIAGTGLALIGAFVIVLVPIFHNNLGDKSGIIPLVVLGGCAVFGVVMYLVAKRVQARRGVDLALAYKALPAD